MEALINFVKSHKEGSLVGIYSVCSAHPLVIEAAILQAQLNQQLVLIEATSNQVNQDGGYTGMKPVDFANMVYDIADKVCFPRNNVLLGGDHLGPNCWQQLSAEEAMARSEVLIKEYVLAGFRKIHLDCSMSCEGDPSPLNDNMVAERAARLCDVAESTWKMCGGEAPVYIIGTEVPVPGGALEALTDELEVTSAQAAKLTLETHKLAFTEFGIGEVWPRVIGLVVQPGVEFDHHNVIHYQAEKAQPLVNLIESQPYMVYEAHSTDYQNPQAYQELVRDHFAILKVGPALTFSLREALYALDRIEQEWLGCQQASHLRATIEQVMRENPQYWQSHYHEVGHQQYLDCSYSLSDRIRYYWPHPQVQKAIERLFDNLTQSPPPITILSQYMAHQAKAVAEGVIENAPQQLVIHKIMEVTHSYAQACFSHPLAVKEHI